MTDRVIGVTGSRSAGVEVVLCVASTIGVELHVVSRTLAGRRQRHNGMQDRLGRALQVVMVPFNQTNDRFPCCTNNSRRVHGVEETRYLWWTGGGGGEGGAVGVAAD